MAVIYLEPQDLTPAQAARILEYLNTVRTAAEIAARIEFPGEPDIGLRLGERLLVARATLGGSYSDLRQVAAVPLIGPERFTEICVGLLGVDPRLSLQDLSSLLEGQLARVDRLRDDLERLRQGLEQVHLDFTIRPQSAWLGQALDIAIFASDAGGRPLIKRDITVEVSSGIVEGGFGFAVRRGSALTLATGADGSVRLRLRPVAIEPLTLAQEAALEAALTLLDASAASPNLIADQLLKFVALYRAEREHTLRQAVDVYVRTYKASLLERLNPDNLSFEWPFETSVLQAHAHPDTGGAQTLAHAVGVVRWKNWVGAWLEALAGHLAGQSTLGAAFGAAKRRGATGYRLVDSIIGEAHGFVADQRGLAAELASRRVVKESIGQFLGEGLDGVDEDTQRELFSNLEIAADQLTAAHRGAIGVVAQTRVDIGAKIETVDKTFTEQLSSFQVETNRLSQQIDLVKDDISKIQLDVGGLQTNFDAMVLNVQTVKTDLETVQKDIRSVKTDIGGVKTELSGVNTEISGVKTQIGGIQTDIGNVQLDLSKLRVRPGGE